MEESAGQTSSRRRLWWAVGGAVIDHQYMKTLVELENGLEDIGNIFPFVVSRYDNDLFQLAICVIYKNTIFRSECHPPIHPSVLLSLF